MRGTVTAALRCGALAIAVVVSTVVVQVPTAAAASMPSTVSISRGLSMPTIASATLAAREAGARVTVVRQGTISLVAHRRGGSVVESIGPGVAYPVSLYAVNAAPIDTLLGADVGRTLRQGGVVLGQTSARVRRARVGDDIDVVGWNGKRLRLRVGAIVPDRRALSSELLVSQQVASRLGVARNSQVIIWGASRSRLTAAMSKRFAQSAYTRSWHDTDTDPVLSQAQLKAKLGEFAVRANGAAINQDQAWLNRNIVQGSVPIIGSVWCNRAVIPPLRRALAEVQRRGLSRLINVADTRRSGGCFGGAREVRGSSGHNLSRHSWGAAIDINPTSNPFGGRVRMDSRIVDIFRRQGFAWGGTWDIPDGMHFEYVG